MTKEEVIGILKESLTVEVITDTTVKEMNRFVGDNELEVEVNVLLMLDGKRLSTGVSTFTVPL